MSLPFFPHKCAPSSVTILPVYLSLSPHRRAHSSVTMQKALLILVAAAVLAFQCTQAQFSFSLPGNWGNGKRGFNFALPGRWGNVKRNGAGRCSDLDKETVLNIYKTIHVSTFFKIDIDKKCTSLKDILELPLKRLLIATYVVCVGKGGGGSGCN